MDDFSEVIFKNAIIKEQIAQRLYQNLGKRAKSEKIKNILYRLAEEEIMHEELFKKMNPTIIKIVNKSATKDISLIRDDPKNIMSQDLEDINNVLDFAITEEQKAYEDYSRLLNYIDFNESREVIKEIAEQELKHRSMLQKVKINFNKDDWSFMKPNKK